MEEIAIPATIQPLIDAYLHALEPLHSHFYGIYIFGSIAQGACEELASDIDVIALTQGEWLPSELKRLKTLHTNLIKTYSSDKRLFNMAMKEVTKYWTPLQFLSRGSESRCSITIPRLLLINSRDSFLLPTASLLERPTPPAPQTGSAPVSLHSLPAVELACSSVPSALLL
jgi:predicted nucleotidyltransferase